MDTNLFQEFKFPSGAVLKNRIVLSPMTIQAAFYDGGVTQEMIDYYAYRADDIGAIIVEGAFVDDKGRAFPGALGISKDEHVRGLKRLATSIKEKGAKAVLQIYHAGRMAYPTLNGGAQPIGPSAVSALRTEAVTPRALTTTEIIEMIQKFKQATRRAIEAGFDGVEIHGANTYLIQQFYSPHSNRREDEWGGDRKQRCRFAQEVIQAVKEAVTEAGVSEFIVGYRFSPEEIEEPGIRFDDTMFLLNELAEMELDYLHFSMNSCKRTSLVNLADKQPLIEKYFEQQSKVLAQIPIIGGGGIQKRKDAEEALAAGYDLVAVGKTYLVEPKWATKVMAKQETKRFAKATEQETLKIPNPLWDSMSFIVVDRLD